MSTLDSHYDMKTTAVDSAAKAVDAIKQIQPDILISDVGLPVEDGYTLIRKIRQLAPEHGGQIPAIALTGYASQQDRSYALEADYQEHLAKPVDLDILIELVRTLLNRDRSAKQSDS
ncbi:MAG: response regulator [Pyrinomonadaceae bacterium]